jgi:signal transduction histidine kinase
MSLHKTTLGTGLRIGAVFLCYVAAGKLGLTLAAVSGFAALVWAPTGLSLAALLLFGYGVWPGIWLGAFVVNSWTGAPIAAALAIAVGNTLEAVVGALALRRLTRFAGAFNRLRHVMGLIGPVALGSTLVSATIGVAALCIAGIVPMHRIGVTWRAWWVGDALGDLIVGAFLLAWATIRPAKIKPINAAEAILLAGALVAISIAVFFRKSGVASYPFDFPYLLFPLFVWASTRFNLRGATAATVLVAVFAIWGTTLGRGPFAKEGLADGLLTEQTFLGCAALAPLVVAGTISDLTRADLHEVFVAALSHDLKSPLTAIQMSANLLARTSAAEVLPEHVKRHSQLVHRCVARMVRLIADLLDTTAVEAGHLSVNRHEEDAHQLIAEAVESARPLATAKGQTVCAEAIEPVIVVCDKERVLEVLSNLICNAIKFTRNGGAIKVTVRRDCREARLSVQDNGMGIAPAQLRHIFERYWHGESESGGGTGLGLFIAKGIVEAHSGKIWVESRFGAGSTFHFTLPMQDARSDRPLHSRSPSVGSVQQL